MLLVLRLKRNEDIEKINLDILEQMFSVNHCQKRHREERVSVLGFDSNNVKEP